MSTNTFLKLGDIEGESTISGFEKQMELINFTNGFHQPTSPIRSSTGPTTGQAVHSMMNVTKYLDSSSQYLQGPVERQGPGFRGAHLLPYGQRRRDQVP